MIREVVVLGSGGSRFVTITQRRGTGGLALALDDGFVIIDPGPGSIASFNQLGLDPFKVKGILISHRHPDHYCDAEVYIEAMTGGGSKKRGLLAAARSVLEGVYDRYPAISDYHMRLPERTLALAPGDQTPYSGVTVKALRTLHHDPYTIGFRIEDGSRCLSYLPDTELKPEVAEGVRDSDLLILSVLRPGGERYPSHLCSEEVVELVNEAKPKKVLLTHFGARMIYAPPEQEAKIVFERTGVATVAAYDGLRMSLSEPVV